MSDNLLLSLLWFLPLLGSLAVLLLPDRAAQRIKVTALGVTLATLVLALVAYAGFVRPGDSGLAPAHQTLQERAEANSLITDNTGRVFRQVDVPGDLVTRSPWIPYFNIQYSLGLDGISLSLVLLTALISVLACLSSWSIDRQVKGYFSLYLLLLASMMGVFLALDLFLFYVFFEVMLLPMYFLIAIWGGRTASTRRSSSCSTRCSARSSSWWRSCCCTSGRATRRARSAPSRSTATPSTSRC
jgi:NADH-quinone oxidoreductase subunit M